MCLVASIWPLEPLNRGGWNSSPPVALELSNRPWLIGLTMQLNFSLIFLSRPYVKVTVSCNLCWDVFVSAFDVIIWRDRRCSLQPAATFSQRKPEISEKIFISRKEGTALCCCIAAEGEWINLSVCQHSWDHWLHSFVFWWPSNKQKYHLFLRILSDDYKMLFWSCFYKKNTFCALSVRRLSWNICIFVFPWDFLCSN